MVKRVVTSIITVAVLMGVLVSCGGSDSITVEPDEDSREDNEIRICNQSTIAFADNLEIIYEEFQRLRFALEDAIEDLPLTTTRLFIYKDQISRHAQKAEDAIFQLGEINLCNHPVVESPVDKIVEQNLIRVATDNWKNELERGNEPSTATMSFLEESICEMLSEYGTFIDWRKQFMSSATSGVIPPGLVSCALPR